MPKRYKVQFRCDCCGNVFEKTLRSLDTPDPPCPNLACPGPHFNRADRAAITEEIPDNVTSMPDRMDWQSGRAPAHTGANNQVKAVDATAEIVMQDYGLSDLRDGVRPGETMAPKLAPKLQQMADGFFGGGAAKGMGVNSGQLARRAMSGAMRPTGPSNPDPVKILHDNKYKPPINIVAGDK